MKTANCNSLFLPLFILTAMAAAVPAQTLINIDFGAGTASSKTGLAAAGMGTNDFWNLYRHYDPKFVPGMPLVSDGKLAKLKFSDGAESPVSVAVSNAPGVWGNSSGDPMYDRYIFAQNDSNLTVTITDLAPGQYHFYLYGHADADVTGEQNSVFTLKIGTNTFGPLTQMGGSAWKAGLPWVERAQYVVFRDVAVDGKPITVDVAPGPNGVAVLNGLQILSRGTSPPRPFAAAAPKPAPASTNLLFHQIHYDGNVSDTEARFAVNFQVESMTTNEISEPLFEGDVAIESPLLPDGLRIVGQGRQTRLFCSRPGKFNVKLGLLAKITKEEPWNRISVVGPVAAIASVAATGTGEGLEIQLLSGISDEQGSTSGQMGTDLNSAPAAGSSSAVHGFLGADRTLSLRWQSKAAEISRKSLVSVESGVNAQITPTVIKFTTALRYEILQAAVPRLTIGLPSTQSLTKIQGSQIRDWQIKPDGPRQVLTIEFIKPIEKSYEVTLFSEQAVESTALAASLEPPQPLGVERESGSLTLTADDTTVEIQSTPGLRQINAPGGSLAAYRFNSRPVSLVALLRRIEPVLKVADRASVRLEETRLLVRHSLGLTVEKSGIYSLALEPQPGFVVSEVKGEGVDDWKIADGKLAVSFAARVLGARKIDVQLEQALREFPGQITVLPLKVIGATNAALQLGAAAAPGIRLKTAELVDLREVPVSTMAEHSDESLAFVSEQPDWQLTLAAEKLSPRIVAEVFDLVTIGDGLVGGSATIRYGIINQGVQSFQVAVPAHWKNVEFTGANIRRKEQQSNVWTIALQDKAWGGYTLVLSYDYPFDPKGTTLDLAGAHALGVERETGSLGVMMAANLKLTPAAPTEPLRRVDEAELSESDRALCTRPLLLAYKYTGGAYRQTVQVARFEELAVLEAVADRIELTSVLTEQGQLLTQSSFMVKNNEKQFQKFKLPKDSEFWSSYVNGQPAKPERDGPWLLVPLPREADRDQAFAVDIVFAQHLNLKSSLFPRRVELAAPLTDIPNTYAEWQVFVPAAQRLSRFGGSMTVARGTTYDWRDAWQAFLQFYGNLIENHAGVLLFCSVVGVVLILAVAAQRRGARGALTVVLFFAVLAILAAMMLPALSRAKARAQRISAVNNLKQIGLAAKTWALDNGAQMPPNFEVMSNELGSEKVLIDPNTGRQFIYSGAGKSEQFPEAILAYSPSDANGRAVLFADGSVQLLSEEKFQEAWQRDAALPRLGAAQAAPASPAGAAALSALNSAPTAASPPVPSPTPAPGAGPPGGGFGGGARAAAPALAAGVSPIRIEVPRMGQAFSFTKVLNAGQEPLTISVSMMRLSAYRTLQMLVQVSGFLFGLALLWWLLSRTPRSSFWMSVAVVLILWSIASLLTMWRLLHVGLITAAPMLLLATAGWLVWRFWPRHERQPAEPLHGPQDSPAAAVPLMALFALFSFAVGSRGEEPVPAAGLGPVSIVSATYTGAISGKVAQLDASLALTSSTTNQTLPLFSGEVAIESFHASGDVQLIRDGAGVGVLLPGRGPVTLDIRLLARVGGDVTRRQLAFAIPPALSSRVSLLLDEPDAEVECPTALSLRRTGTNEQTRVEAITGSVGRFELNWTPRVKRAAEIAATVFANNTALVSLGAGLVHTRAILDYQISQGELNHLRVQIPAGQRLLRVESESLRVWEVKDDVLSVELLKGGSPARKLILETERSLDQLPQIVAIEVPHALDVKRETGLLGVSATEELSLAVQGASGLQRVDAEEFYQVLPEKKDGLASAFRFLKPVFSLTVRAEIVQPQIEALAHNRIRVRSESVRLDARIDYLIKRAGIFMVQLVLPQDYHLESVKGTNVAQWLERLDGSARILEVSLKERTLGAWTLELELTRNYSEPPKTLSIFGVHPAGAQKLSGFVTVSTEQGLAAKTQALEGLTEIPFNSAGLAPTANAAPSIAGEVPAAPPGSALAYKFIDAVPSLQPSWVLSISTETVEPWVRAEIANTITLTETLVSGRATVKYEIANAPVKEFRLRVPAVLKDVEITGDQIRRRDQTNDEWRVELQSKVRGSYELSLTWEMPRSPGTNLVELPGIQALDVERETGFVALLARPPLQVTDKSSGELLNVIDSRELPPWAGRPDPATVLAYRYLRPGYQLVVEANRFDEAAVLQALIDSARLTTVVADDGQMMTEVSLGVRNHGRQHLEVELPPGAKVWSAFVGGEPVRPGNVQGKLLLPLAREADSEATVPVEFTFISSGKFPVRRGTLTLASPHFDIPLKNGHWDLYLPPDYEYSRFAGSMNRTSDSAAPLAQVYSLSEYTVQQKTLREQAQADLLNDLGETKKNLYASNPNLRGAMSRYGQLKYKAQQYQPSPGDDRGLKQVEEDLRKAQSSNLVNAQNGFFFENAGRLGDQHLLQLQEQSLAANRPAQSPTTEGMNPMFNYDTEVAAQQWDKLERAQQVTVTKLAPLRVNLPTRGLHYSFGQVLQTEIGRPMTIALLAENTKVPNWPARILLGFVCFAALWIIMAWLGNHFAPRRT
ncbi:membrane hypothetical protein [Verrucomicrobia bacterium]|nr:membrane hypothetical protein [Verrucomicrobiota bacterium]